MATILVKERNSFDCEDDRTGVHVIVMLCRFSQFVHENSCNFSRMFTVSTNGMETNQLKILFQLMLWILLCA